MGKSKTTSTEEPGRDCIVVWWDGFGQEHQSTDRKPEAGKAEYELPVQWEFTPDEAASVCRREIKRGALKAEVWRPGPTPERIASFERALSGHAVQTFPKKEVVLR